MINYEKDQENLIENSEVLEVRENYEEDILEALNEDHQEYNEEDYQEPTFEKFTKRKEKKEKITYRKRHTNQTKQNLKEILR